MFLCNCGAEAVDGAIKLARRTTGRPGIIAFRRAFHGRTLGATTLTTAKARYRQGYDPLLPACTSPPGACRRTTPRPGGVGRPRRARPPAGAEVAPSDVAAIVVEPVLGEGGYVVPPGEPGWPGLRERCDRHGILLVFDEVQSGLGRTGRPFAAETLGVAPDVLLFAKGVASGLPLGGIVAGRALMDRWPNGAHGSTFGGNPVACAAALATHRRARGRGPLRPRPRPRRARRRAARAPSWRQPAGSATCGASGLMIGVELADAADGRRRASSAASTQG